MFDYFVLEGKVLTGLTNLVSLKLSKSTSCDVIDDIKTMNNLITLTLDRQVIMLLCSLQLSITTLTITGFSSYHLEKLSRLT